MFQFVYRSCWKFFVFVLEITEAKLSFLVVQFFIFFRKKQMEKKSGLKKIILSEVNWNSRSFWVII